MDRLLEDANLEEYLLVVNHQDNSIIMEDSLLVLQNQRTSTMELAEFEQVAHYFNLLKVDNGDGTFSCMFRSAECTSNAGSKGIKEWTKPETVRIIQLVTDYTDQVGTLKRFATKKVMWKQVSMKLNDEFNISVNPTQVENRYKTVLNKNKKRIEHNRISGNDRMVTLYDEEFDLLAKKDSTIDPYMMTQHGEIIRDSGATSASSNSSTVGAVPETSEDARPSTSTSCNVDIPDGEEEIPERNEEKEKKKERKTKKEKKADNVKQEDKEQKKKTNISVMTELYRNQCEFRSQEREENRKEKELAKAKADTYKMERFQYAQDKKDIRHQQKLEVLKDLVNVLKSKDAKDDQEKS